MRTKAALCAWALVCLCAFARCDHTGESLSKLNQKEYEDLSYGDQENQKLDLLFPDYPARISAPIPVVLYIHGGAWVEGDKQEGKFTAIKNLALEAGIAAASMNYRLLLDGADCGGMLDDVDRAIAFIKRKSSSLGVTLDKLSIAGVSAGAHLALLYSYTHSANANNSPIPIDLCVSFSGPTDFTDPAWFTASSTSLEEKCALISALTRHAFTPADLTALQNGGALALSPAKQNALKSISPVFQIHPAIPPTLFAHGRADDVVPFSNAEKLAQAIDASAPGKNLGFADFPHSGHELDDERDKPILNDFLRQVADIVLGVGSGELP